MSAWIWDMWDDRDRRVDMAEALTRVNLSDHIVAEAPGMSEDVDPERFRVAARYLAVRDDNGAVNGACALLTHMPTAGWTQVQVYMDWELGTFHAGADAVVLDVLTPTDEPYAITWREACRRRLALAGQAT